MGRAQHELVTDVDVVVVVVVVVRLKEYASWYFPAYVPVHLLRRESSTWRVGGGGGGYQPSGWVRFGGEI